MIRRQQLSTVRDQTQQGEEKKKKFRRTNVGAQLLTAVHNRDGDGMPRNESAIVRGKYKSIVSDGEKEFTLPCFFAVLCRAKQSYFVEELKRLLTDRLKPPKREVPTPQKSSGRCNTFNTKKTPNKTKQNSVTRRRLCE